MTIYRRKHIRSWCRWWPRRWAADRMASWPTGRSDFFGGDAEEGGVCRLARRFTIICLISAIACAGFKLWGKLGAIMMVWHDKAGTGLPIIESRAGSSSRLSTSQDRIAASAAGSQVPLRIPPMLGMKWSQAQRCTRKVRPSLDRFFRVWGPFFSGSGGFLVFRKGSIRGILGVEIGEDRAPDSLTTGMCGQGIIATAPNSH